MRPPVAAMMQEMMTMGVILASNSTLDGADTANPPPGIFARRPVKLHKGC